MKKDLLKPSKAELEVRLKKTLNGSEERFINKNCFNKEEKLKLIRMVNMFSINNYVFKIYV